MISFQLPGWRLSHSNFHSISCSKILGERTLYHQADGPEWSEPSGESLDYSLAMLRPHPVNVREICTQGSVPQPLILYLDRRRKIFAHAHRQHHHKHLFVKDDTLIIYR
jgi:hypothetical protein